MGAKSVRRPRPASFREHSYKSWTKSRYLVRTLYCGHDQHAQEEELCHPLGEGLDHLLGILYPWSLHIPSLLSLHYWLRRRHR